MAREETPRLVGQVVHGRQQHHRCRLSRRETLPRALEELPPVHERHHQVEKDQIWRMRLEPRQRLVAVGSRLYVEARLADDLGKRAEDVWIILDYEDVSAHTKKLGVFGTIFKYWLGSMQKDE